MNNKNIKKILSKYIYISVLVLGMFWILTGVIDNFYNDVSMLVMITFAMNFLFIMFQIQKTYVLGYSLDDMFWIFMMTFFILTPIIQYLTNQFPWSTYLMRNENLIIYSNFLILVFMIVYYLSRKGTKVTKKKNNSFFNFKNEEKTLNISYILAMLSVLVVIAVLGIDNLFMARNLQEKLDISKSIFLIVHNLRVVPVVLFIFQIQYYKKNKKIHSKIQFFTTFLMVIFCNFPLVIARNKAAIIYIGIFLTIFPILKNKYMFKYLFFTGVLFVFPLINIFRNNSLDMVFSGMVSLPNPADSYISGDFDAYNMFMRSIFFAHMSGFTFGTQLLGALFFFVPRSIWMTKAIGTGQTVAEGLGWNYTNISMPLPGEGYIDFGIIGVIIYAWILGFLTKKMDLKYTFSIKDRININILDIFYPLLLGSIFFMLRGDLQGTFAYTIGIIIPAVAFLFIDKLILIGKRR